VEFDSLSHAYRAHELPEIGTLSETALLANGNDIWLGLEGRREVEGASPGCFVTLQQTDRMGSDVRGP
jgi:hypothetical protein